MSLGPFEDKICCVLSCWKCPFEVNYTHEGWSWSGTMFKYAVQFGHSSVGIRGSNVCQENIFHTKWNGPGNCLFFFSRPQLLGFEASVLLLVDFRSSQTPLVLSMVSAWSSSCGPFEKKSDKRCILRLLFAHTLFSSTGSLITGSFCVSHHSEGNFKPVESSDDRPGPHT